jgi:hypothetical protein
MVFSFITAAACPGLRKIFMEQQEFHKIFLPGECPEGNKVIEAEDDKGA